MFTRSCSSRLGIGKICLPQQLFISQNTKKKKIYQIVPECTSKRDSFVSSKNCSSFLITVVLVLVGTNFPGRGSKELKCCRE